MGVRGRGLSAPLPSAVEEAALRSKHAVVGKVTVAPSDLSLSLAVNPHSRVTLGWRSHCPSCPVGWDELETRPLTQPSLPWPPLPELFCQAGCGGPGSCCPDPTSHSCWERIA